MPLLLPWGHVSGETSSASSSASRYAWPHATTGVSNKILWTSRVPRNGATLVIHGTRRSDRLSATTSQPADTVPGEIYPSIVDLPGTGCWQVDLAWSPNKGRLYLYYGP